MSIYFGYIFLVVPSITAQQSDRGRFRFLQHDYKVKFERMQLMGYDKRLVNHMSVVTFNYNRTCPAVNMTFNNKVDNDRSFRTVIQAYKFMSNEYRAFPLRFEVGFCEAIEKDIIGLGQVIQCGNFTKCFAAKGKTYHICNYTPAESKFPPYVPNGKYMVEMLGMRNSNVMWIMHTYLTISRAIGILD